MMYEDGTINQETLNALIALKAAMGRNDTVSLWNVDESLKNPPKATFGEKKAGSLVQEVYYEGEPYLGKPTRVFAYLGKPQSCRICN
jgi:hypothetical protein